ncbi:MAG: hypothetical protein Rubg2KO_17890 [Rubricoccaceae bacterium]
MGVELGDVQADASIHALAHTHRAGSECLDSMGPRGRVGERIRARSVVRIANSTDSPIVSLQSVPTRPGSDIHWPGVINGTR